mmetsp:Transcript_119311/g.297642  ORF Transcript_119311/g.297642 Transcript_119311/m.297642 type:complete len:280 (+) Transcript_119311:426-1265(+)
MPDMFRSLSGFLSSFSFEIFGALAWPCGLWVNVRSISSTQSDRTPAAEAGPQLLKDRGRMTSPTRENASISEPTFWPALYCAKASGSNLTCCGEQLLLKCNVTPESPLTWLFSRFSASSRSPKIASSNLLTTLMLGFVPSGIVTPPNPLKTCTSFDFEGPFMLFSRSKNQPASTPASCAGPVPVKPATLTGAKGLPLSNLNAAISSPTGGAFLPALYFTCTERGFSKQSAQHKLELPGTEPYRGKSSRSLWFSLATETRRIWLGVFSMSSFSPSFQAIL